MYKKGIIVTLLAIVIFGLVYQTNVKLIKDENKKVQDEMQTKIDQLEKEKNDFGARLYDLESAKKDETPLKEEKKGSLSLSNVQIQSSDMYNEGTLKGAVYGSFNIVATVKNISDADIINAKVTSNFIRNTLGEKTIGNDIKAQRIEKLSPGQEKEIVFTGYKVNHPEIQQEVIVNLFHNNMADVEDASNIKKINIKVAFPPGSND